MHQPARAALRILFALVAASTAACELDPSDEGSDEASEDALADTIAANLCGPGYELHWGTAVDYLITDGVWRRDSISEGRHKVFRNGGMGCAVTIASGDHTKRKRMVARLCRTDLTRCDEDVGDYFHHAGPVYVKIGAGGRGSTHGRVGRHHAGMGFIFL